MNFHTYTTLYDTSKQLGWTGTVDDFYKASYRSMEAMALSDENKAGARWLCRAELAWILSCRPYYKLWPSIVPAFLKLRFNIPNLQLSLPKLQSAIVIRISENHPRELLDLRSIMFFLYRVNIGTQLVMLIRAGEKNEWAQFQGLVLRDDETIEQSMNQWEHPPCLRQENGLVVKSSNITDIPQKDTSFLLDCLKISVTLILLANDPSIIHPDVLADDRQQFDASTDQELRQRLIDKARKRGIVGWRIGEQYETIPHIRRPHFGWRWTEKGRKTPRFVSIKGSIVHRQKLTEVPTGWIEDDGTEVEP